MKLVWSQFARHDRRAIYAYIATDDPHAAAGVDERIEIAAEQLISFPESGRPGRVDGTRELVVGRIPYIIPYRIVGDVIRILRVLHGAQLWPDALPDETMEDGDN